MCEKHAEHTINRPNMHVVGSMCFHEFASCLKNSAHNKKCMFSKWTPSFLDSVFHHLRDAQKNNNNEPKAHFRVFWEAKWAPGPI